MVGGGWDFGLRICLQLCASSRSFQHRLLCDETGLLIHSSSINRSNGIVSGTNSWSRMSDRIFLFAKKTERFLPHCQCQK